MPDMPLFRSRAKVGLKLGLTLTLLLTVVGQSLAADVVNFMNGKIMRGKLFRVTGDIIEFSEGGRFGSKLNVQRIQLTNRQDIIETRNRQRYFGEIVYLDKFKMELRTNRGLVILNRLKVKQVVLGTPASEAVSTLSRQSEVPTTTNANTAASTATPFPMKPVVEPPKTPGAYRPPTAEDQDEIPAIGNW